MAIVGYGVVGPLHALAYEVLPRVFPDLPRKPQVALIVDPNPMMLARARSQWRSATRPPRHELFDEFDIDMVDCCAPADVHAEVCTPALAAGLSVFCEKPLTGVAEASARLAAQAAARGVAFGINFNFRFVPALREARRLILDGLLGDVRSVRVEYHRSSNLTRHRNARTPTISRRGALLDLGPHAIDLVHYLFGKIVKVAARTHFLTPGHGAADDLAKLEVILGNGALGSIEVSKMTAGATNDLHVFAYGTGGSLRFSTREPDALDLFRGADYSASHQSLRFGVGALAGTTAIIPAETTTSVLLWHAASIAAFADAVAAHRMPAPSAVDGLGVDLVLDAAHTSIARSAEWVPVSTW